MNAAKSERSAVLAGYLGGVLYFLFALLPLIMVLCIRILYPDMQLTDTQRSIPEVIFLHSSMPVPILLYGALISAIFSTCSGAILAPSSLMAENVIRPVFGDRINEKRFLLLLKISVISITAIGLAMALSRKNIYELVGESSILGLVSMLVPMSAALFWKRANARGAVASMVLGFTAWALAEHVIRTEVPALFWGLLASLAGLISGTMFFSKNINKEIESKHQ